MSDTDHLFQRLCYEAVLACGADMAAVERYVSAKIETMTPAESARIRRDLERFLTFSAPNRSFRSH